MRLQIVCALRRRCGSATRPRLSKMHHFRLICSRQCISCYPEKRMLYVIRLNQEAMKTTLEEVRHFVIKDQFTADFRRW